VSTEPVVAPPPGNPRFPLFDSLRAIAALSVLTTHAGFLAGANLHAWYGRYTARLDIGVAIFFVISGFLLYRPFVAARLGAGRAPGAAIFYWRRVLRIVPAYWLALTVLALSPGLPQMWGDHWWAYFGFIQIYRQDWLLGGLLPAWSLCVEMSFYAILPLVALAMRRLPVGRSREAILRSELALLALMQCGGIAFRVWVRSSEGGVPGSSLYSTLPGNLTWFALGMALAVGSAACTGRASPRPVRVVERWPSLCWAIAALLFWVVSTRIGITAEFPQRYTGAQWLAEHLLYGAVGFFLLLPAVFGDSRGGLPRAILRNRVLGWLGLVSYGIFLWHLPLVERLANGATRDWWGEHRMLGVWGAGLTVSTACAAASYYLFERPILRYKDRPPWRRELPARMAAPEAVAERAG
jgi:peptidoglycan/LPS O-acetylase OafA/YrhL